MHGQVEPRERRVVAEPLDDLQRVGVLRIDRPRAVHEGVVALDGADLGDQRHELGLQVVEDLAHLRGLHARLVVVEESVVGLVVALEAVDVAALEVDRALEHGAEELVVVLRPRLRPHVVALDGGAGHLGSQVGGDAARLLPVAARRADQARVVRVVIELLLVVGELVEQRSGRVGDELLVRDPVERRHLVPTNDGAARRHHHGLIPEQDLLRAAQVVDLGQTCLQLGETLLHRRSSDRGYGGTLAAPHSRFAAHAARGTRVRKRHTNLGGQHMGIIAFIILGAIGGAIAKALLPGDDPGGFIVTTIIGIVGAILGGFLAAALFDADPMDEFFDISSLADGDRRLDHPAAHLSSGRRPRRPPGSRLGLGLEGERLAAARERAHGRQPPAVLAPDVGEDANGPVADLVDVEPAGFAAAVRARLAEPGCDRHDHRVLALRARELELAPLRDGALVDVPGEHEVGASLDEPGEDSVPLRDRLLARAPGGAEQVVVEDDDPQRALGRVLEDLRRVPNLRVANPTRLVPPRPHGVEPDDDQAVRAVDGLGRLPEPLELLPGAGEALRERVGNVVVAGDRQQRQLQPAQERGRRLVLGAADRGG